MKHTIHFLFTILISILYSCEYPLSEVYDHPANRDIAPPQIQVVELSIDTDTLYVYKSREITFKFQSDNQEIIRVSYSVDGVEMGYSNSTSGTFNLTVARLQAGIHDLEIKVFTVSGSGSLADQLGAEAFVLSDSWKLVMLDLYNAEMSKTIENGLLHVKWKEFTACNFREFVLYKSVPNTDKIEIKRLKANEFVDSSYVGEIATYYVEVLTTDVNPFTTGALSLQKDLPVLSYSVEDSNRYLVTWNKSKFYNAVNTFEMYHDWGGTDPATFKKFWETRNPDDTVYQVLNAGFGEDMDFILRLVPRETNIDFVPGSYSLFQTFTEGTFGFPFKFHEIYGECIQVSKDEFLYRDCNAIYRYSLSQKQVVEKLEYEYSGCYSCNFDYAQGSNSGKYIASFVDCEKDIFFARGTELDNYSIHKLQNITTGNRYFAVSDTGTAIILNREGGLNLYDLSTSTPLGIYKNYRPSSLKDVKISAGGEYFIVSADTLRLVHFKNEQFTDVWKKLWPHNIKFFEFHPFNPDHVIFWNGSKLSVYQCSDFSLVREFELKDVSLLDIDYYNNEMLTYSNGHLFVRNFSDGSLIKDVPSDLNSPGECYLVDHTIVYGPGLLYFIYPD